MFYAVEFGRSLLMFWGNISPPSSGLKSMPNKKAAICVLVSYLTCMLNLKGRGDRIIILHGSECKCNSSVF